MLERTAQACRENYLSFRNVLGVGAGFKFKGGRPLLDCLCIHFYVRKKLRKPARATRLPRFVYARRSNGSLDRSHQIRTDVLELRQPKFASCKAGCSLDVIGESGTITFLFRNRVDSAPGYFLITCAHVAGDVVRPVPADPTIKADCCPSEGAFAETLVNSTHEGDTLKYDVAVARVSDECSPQPDKAIRTTPDRLSAFLDPSDLRPGLRFDCAFGVSNTVSATVTSYRTALPLILDGREYWVENLFLIDQAPRPGDSGGLLYVDTLGAGILVGLANGHGLFQPLAESFEHIQNLSPVPIRCF